MTDTAQPTPELTLDTVINSVGSELHSEPQKVAAGRGLNWLTEGWALMMKEPLVFAAMSVISLVAIFIISLVPLLELFK